MNRLSLPLFVYFLLVLLAPVTAQDYADGPVGFEDPALLAKVMEGKIVMEDKVDTKVEFRTVAKAFFNRTAPEAYAALATNHPKYADLFTEVKKGETLKVSTDKTEFDYKLHLVFKVGPFSQDVYPEGHQKVTFGADATAEGRIDNEILNYKEEIKSATQVTRLIPYENGILVEDDVHVVLVKPSSQSGMIKKKLKEFFGQYVSTFRKELQGQY